MVDEKGRVTMIDLGHSKRIDRDRTYTICGTTHSMPPEIYEEKGYSYEFDHYGFGILIF
jgi:protein kinase A